MDQAPRIETGHGKLRYDKERRTIVVSEAGGDGGVGYCLTIDPALTSRTREIATQLLTACEGTNVVLSQPSEQDWISFFNAGVGYVIEGAKSDLMTISHRLAQDERYLGK